jgi:iron complex outermembrane recepter protein
VSRFIGEPGDGYDTERKTFGWLFEHQFNDNWSFRQNFRMSRTYNDSHYHYADFFSIPGGWGMDPIGQRVIGRINDKSLTWTRMTGIDNHVEGHFDTCWWGPSTRASARTSTKARPIAPSTPTPRSTAWATCR